MIDAKVATEQLIATIRSTEAQARLKKVCASVNGDRGRPVKWVFRLSSDGIEFSIGSPNCPMEQITAAETAKGIIEPIRDPEPETPVEILAAEEHAKIAGQAYEEAKKTWLDAKATESRPGAMAGEDIAALESEMRERDKALMAAKSRHGQLYRLWRLQLMLAEEERNRTEREAKRKAEQASRQNRVLQRLKDRITGQKEAQ